MNSWKIVLGLYVLSLIGLGAGCIDSRSPASTSTSELERVESTASQSAPPENAGSPKNPSQVAGHSSTAQPSTASQQTASRRPTRIRSISFDDIKFEMDKDAKFERSMLTPAIEKLNGTKIRVRGWIYPSYRQEGITNFILVRDNMECCFGPGAALYDCIAVDLEPGKSIEYTSQMIAVEGVFEIKEWINEIDGRHMAIYHLTAEKVK